MFPIIQFGTSRFLQAHADLFVSDAIARNDALGSIVVVQTTASASSSKRLQHFAAGRPNSVAIRGLAHGAVVDCRVEVHSIGGGLHADDDWPEVERRFCEARCMISNTGDRGYEIDPDEPESAGAPRSFPAKLAKLLLARRRSGAGPLTLLPCELIPSNGAQLRAAVSRLLKSWGAPEPARRWAAEDCVWANTLVDRIVSEPLEPAGAVAEPYALWAIEDRPGLELPCRHPDIVTTEDLRPYERLKLFILNLGHTWLADIWSARGLERTMTVRRAMSDPAFRPELDSLYDDEVIPVFAAIGMETEAEAYRKTVIERFSNPFLDHRLAEIHNNHDAKKHIRFGGLIALAHSTGRPLALPRIERALKAIDLRPAIRRG